MKAAASLNDLEAEVTLHRLEITIVMQQLMSALDAERANDIVGRFANSYTERSQRPMIARATRREIVVKEGNNPVLAQIAFDPGRVEIVASALKKLKQDKIANQERLAAAASFAVCTEFRPRKWAIQTELSTSINDTATRGGPDDGRSKYRPNRGP